MSRSWAAGTTLAAAELTERVCFVLPGHPDRNRDPCSGCGPLPEQRDPSIIGLLLRRALKGGFGLPRANAAAVEAFGCRARSNMLRLIRVREIRVMGDGDKVCALVGPDLQEGAGGFGDDVPAALADLVQRIRSEDTTIWIPIPPNNFARMAC